MADRLGLELTQTHVGHFTLEQCREAWKALGELWKQEM